MSVANWNEGEGIMRRHKMSGHKSKKMFSKHGSRTHKFNMPRRQPMRGGIRL